MITNKIIYDDTKGKGPCDIWNNTWNSYFVFGKYSNISFVFWAPNNQFLLPKEHMSILDREYDTSAKISRIEFPIWPVYLNQ